MRPSIVRKINSQEPEAEIINQAATIIRQGGVVAFPTRCLYGLGADALNPDAVERIVKIKQRPQDQPILVLIDNRTQLEILVTHIPPAAETIMAAFWPGRVTIVFEATDILPPILTARTGKIGVRLPGHPVASALVKHVQVPITGTSANLSGQPGCQRLQDLDLRVAGQLNLVLDAGALKGGIGSTVVDVTVDPPRILREGKVTAKEVMRSLAET
jgi:L-threonylcarbamoyladenylate synthase